MTTDAPSHDGAGLDVLLVEDDDALREMLTWHLDAAGWRVRGVGDGPAALTACERRLPDLIVLDVMLPGLDGVAVCRALRERYETAPGVLMLTARADEADVVTSLEAGADDYVVKPCRPAELVARLRALARRLARSGLGDILDRAPVRIDTRTHTVTVADRPLPLTATEYALLVTLARDPGRVFSRAELLELVWHTSHQGYARNVDCHVARLRRKFERARMAVVPITAVYGAGYRYGG